MRTILFSALALLVAGCTTPEMQQLSEACEAGNLEACAAHEQIKQQRAQALGQALYQSGGALQQSGQSTYQPRQPMTCLRQGVFVNCY